MDKRAQALEYFKIDTEKHEMQVLNDDGVYRHLLFKAPGTGIAHYNIVTYPGILVFEGDVGCFVFQRLEDMFQFFRTDSGRGDGINPGYWAEKLVGIDRSGFKEFDEEYFNKTVMRELISWIRRNRESTTQEDRRELWEDVVHSVIEADGDSEGLRKQIAAHDFHHKIRMKDKRLFGFSFDCIYETNFTRYTTQFYWVCHAIAHAVKTYDLFKKSEQVTS